MKLLEDMPSPKFLDLKPNRLLLDPKFDSYKLSLDSLPKYTQPFPNGVDKVKPTDDQYSIQHTKLFALYNCLHADPFNDSIIFVVTKDWNVIRIRFNQETTKFEEMKQVWNIPSQNRYKVGKYNVTISFPSGEYAAVSDGCNNLFILETGNRTNDCDNMWKVVYEQSEIPTGFPDNSLSEFVILDTKMHKDGQHSYINLLLLSLKNKSDKDIEKFLEKNEEHFLTTSSNHPFVSLLSWISLKKEENSNWIQESNSALIGPSGLDYGCIECAGTGLLIASENRFAFSHISNQPLKYQESFKKKSCEEAKKPDYVWMQNEKEVTVWFKIPIEARKTDLSVEIKASSISVAYCGSAMLEGEFLHIVKADETVWTINPVSVTDEETQEDGDVSTTDEGSKKRYQSLEIILQKMEANRWEGDSIVKNTSYGQQILDPEFVANIQERLNHLCSDKWNDDPMRSKVCDPQELEECDTLPADTTSFMRIDKDLQCISHVASLGGHQFLFNARLQSFSPLAICIRHDVDAIFWQPAEFEQSKSDLWKLEHVGTFSAMGYVQASKQQRKFTVCPPDLSYVAILDSQKHVYIYRQPSEVGTELRNRRSGQLVQHVSKQHVVSLDLPSDVLGAVAVDQFLFVLTSENVHAIRVKEIDE